jgi:hypothetical protein
MCRVTGRLENNELENSGVAMFFDARRATAMEAPGRNHELQKSYNYLLNFLLFVSLISNFLSAEKQIFLF